LDLKNLEFFGERHIAEFVESGPDRRAQPRGSFDRRAVARAVRRIRVDPDMTLAEALDLDAVAEQFDTENARTGTCGFPIEV